MKDKIFARIEEQKAQLFNMADEIFDKPELKFEEKFACDILCSYLEENGFKVEKGLGKLDTAFKATFSRGDSKYNIGLLCEYDALAMGHGCGHHMQGPAILGAAVAIKDALIDKEYNLIVYGTPGEEGGGGKIKMLAEGYMKELDVALMMHGGPATQVDVKSMAASTRLVKFKGKSAHAALKPENGRSALDALLLTFNGLEFMREHVLEDTRIHYTIAESPGPANTVPSRAVGEFYLRSYNSNYLNSLVERFDKVVQGAALMTETEYEIVEKKRLESKIPSYILNDLMMDNARLVDAPMIKPAREKTGSTDFGNVTYLLPGAVIRIAFVPEGTSSHSQEFLDAGKSEQAHIAIEKSAKILAGTVYDLVNSPDIIEKIKNEFNEYKSKM